MGLLICRFLNAINYVLIYHDDWQGVELDNNKITKIHSVGNHLIILHT